MLIANLEQSSDAKLKGLILRQPVAIILEEMVFFIGKEGLK